MGKNIGDPDSYQACHALCRTGFTTVLKLTVRAAIYDTEDTWCKNDAFYSKSLKKNENKLSAPALGHQWSFAVFDRLCSA